MEAHRVVPSKYKVARVCEVCKRSYHLYAGRRMHDVKKLNLREDSDGSARGQAHRSEERSSR